MILQRQLGMSDVEISDLKTESLETPGLPLILRCTYTLKQQFRRVNERLTGLLRAGFERSYLSPDPVDNRLSPFEIKVLLSFRATVSFDVPEGFLAETSSTATPKLDPRFAVCKEHLRTQDHKVQFEFDCRQPIGNFKASDYASYRQTMAQALSLLEREIVFSGQRR